MVASCTRKERATMQKTDWKGLVERENSKAYAWPEGWSTKEDIAAQLGCRPESVHDMLRCAIRGGGIEVKKFSIWRGGRIVQVVGYRPAPPSGK